MNWDQVEGKWKQLKGSAREHWGELTDNDLEAIAGNRGEAGGQAARALWVCQGAGSEDSR